jgi:signal transduction histidine kinase
MASNIPTDEHDLLTARVLIVDDIADNRALLGRRFARRGFHISEADSGGAALEAVAREPFDVVLLDIQMPDLDGLEVLRRIRANHSEAELPVIMVTGRVESDDIVQALTAGANDYITKPVDFAVALARVKTHAARKHAEDEARQAHEELSHANEDLERRIAERTAELVDANALLQVAVEEARAANKAKDEFLATVSHELRTPLNGMIATSQLLGQTPLTDLQDQLVQLIVTSSGQLNGIVADLLDMLDLTAGGVVLTPGPAKLSVLMAEAAAASREAAQAKGLAFHVRMSPEADGAVNLDGRRLVEVVGKLLDNAVKFTDTGEVTLALARPGPGRLAIEVSDTGIGLSEESRARLFRAFEQADGSATRRYGGLGLGLAISHGLVTLMGGTISAENRPEGGAVFRVEIPA